MLCKTIQDVGGCWQELGELGVEAPRCEVKEGLRIVLEGASRRKECNATAIEAARE
jgi:hypothetical protein